MKGNGKPGEDMMLGQQVTLDKFFASLIKMLSQPYNFHECIDTVNTPYTPFTLARLSDN